MTEPEQSASEIETEQHIGVSAAMSKSQYEDLRDNPSIAILDEHWIGSHGEFDVFVSYAHTVPRRALETDENPVTCPNSECRETWEASTLYRTGDVLRCPQCDGVMRP